jgi:hypothetical protein
MDWTVQPVPDRIVTVDRGPSSALSWSGPTVGRFSLHLKMDRVDPSRADHWTGPDRTMDRAGPWTEPPDHAPGKNYYLKINKFIFQLLLFFTIF